ncbi:MAG: hypothetical protein LUD72_01300 [Bacteroidales bacterium]|nr:hypothetical protein [Bacteroidales bacterium]
MKEFMTINEVAKTGKYSPFFLRRMVKEHRCPGIYSGTRFYVNVPLLDELLNEDSLENAQGKHKSN